VARQIAAGQDHVVRRRQLTSRGVPRWLAQLETRAGRWQRGGRQTLVVHNVPHSLATRQVIGVLEVGSAAALDGVSALQRAGLQGLTDEIVVVSTPRGSTPVRPKGVVVRETRRFRECDVITAGVRRMRPAVAAIHAALWAVSDRQAALFLTMVVQQRIATAGDVAVALDEVRRDKRKVYLRRLISELAGGVQSLGELDVGAGLRRRGLPMPQRQSLRRRANGKEYLDLDFPAYLLVLEVDGVAHDAALARLSDLLRDVRLAAEGQTVIRIPLIAWRLDEEAVLDVLEELFAARGWQQSTAA
jgi:hypothetical protein